MSELRASLLHSDPRVREAKRLVLEALADHQRPILSPRAADPLLKVDYDELLRQIGRIRGADLYYPYLGSGLGSGALVELADGSVKYDMASGIGVHVMGHNHTLIAGASFDAALEDLLMQGNLQQNQQAIPFAQKLLSLANQTGARLEHCFVTTSGAMANENALKILFQKRHPATRVLAFEHTFSGRTLALAGITDKPGFRQGLPTVLAVDYVPFFDPEHPKESTDRALAMLRAHLRRYPGQHAAMCMELVLGEGGFHVGEREFFLAIIELLKAHRVAVWCDEVQTFGRTTRAFAFQHFGLDAFVDVVTVGKITQACATLFSHEFNPRPGLLSQTFTASTAALLAGSAILDELSSGGYFGEDGRNARIHGRFVERFGEIERRHPGWIRGPFGIGAMIAFTPFDGVTVRTKRLLRALFDNGVIAFIAGEAPSRIRFLPPAGAVTDAEIDAVCGILERTMEAEEDKGTRGPGDKERGAKDEGGRSEKREVRSEKEETGGHRLAADATTHAMADKNVCPTGSYAGSQSQSAIGNPQSAM